MRFDSVKKLKGEAFRRLTGVQRSTIEDMVGLLFAAKRRQKAAGGKPNTLCIEDQLLEKSTRRILCIAHGNGRRHDRLFKRSKVRLHPNTRAVIDSGYQGLQRVHAKTNMPKKRSKKNPLSASDKAKNRDISSERVPCENVIAMLKRFKIIADRYRNRRRRFGLRFFLIAAIYNKELQLP